MSDDGMTEREGVSAFSVGSEIRRPVHVSTSVGYALRRAQIRVYDLFFASLADLDTTPTCYTLMLLIRENPGIRSVDLARSLGVARSRMVKLIDDLEGRRMITRETPRNDRRNRSLMLTAQGKRDLKKMEQAVESHEAKLTEGFGAGERERLLDLLWRIAMPCQPAQEAVMEEMKR
jgi:DNA-binding MarR family transcriptional regulator